MPRFPCAQPMNFSVWHSDLKAKCKSLMKPLQYLVAHFPLPRVFLCAPVSQNTVHVEFNEKKSCSFSHNSLPTQHSHILRKIIISNMIFLPEFGFHLLIAVPILPQASAMLSVFLTFGEFKAKPPLSVTL